MSFENRGQIAPFAPVQRQSYCPFARGAILKHITSHQTGIALERCMAERFIDALSLKTAVAPDGAVISFANFRARHTCISANLIWSFVTILCNATGDNLGYILHDIESPTWRLHLSGIPLFVMYFGDIYDCHSPRYSFNSGHDHILVLRLDSFRNRLFPDDELRHLQHQAVRRHFNNRGQKLPLKILGEISDAWKFVMPLEASGDLVKWWRQHD